MREAVYTIVTQRYQRLPYTYIAYLYQVPIQAEIKH